MVTPPHWIHYNPKAAVRSNIEADAWTRKAPKAKTLICSPPPTTHSSGILLVVARRKQLEHQPPSQQEEQQAEMTLFDLAAATGTTTHTPKALAAVL